MHNVCCPTEPNPNPLLFDTRVVESYPDLQNPFSVNVTSKTRDCDGDPLYVPLRKGSLFQSTKRGLFLLFIALVLYFLCKCV